MGAQEGKSAGFWTLTSEAGHGLQWSMKAVTCRPWDCQKVKELSDGEWALSEQSLYNCKNTTETWSRTVDKMLSWNHIYSDMFSIDLSKN